MRDAKRKQPLSLENTALDYIILTWDPRIIRNILKLPDSLLEKLDKRCIEIQHTKEYKERFKSG